MGADDVPGAFGLRARNPNQVADPNGVPGGGGGSGALPPAAATLPSPRGLDSRARTPSPNRSRGSMLVEEEESKENALEGPYSRIGMVIECVSWLPSLPLPLWIFFYLRSAHD